MGGSRVRYRPGLFIIPPPNVRASLSLLNQVRSYAIQPRNDCFGPPLPPWHVTPPPYSQPASAVIENAILEMPGDSGLLKYLTSMLSSVCRRTRLVLPKVSVPFP